MKLVSDWRRVVAVSLSFWMQIAGLVALIVPELLFSLTGRDTNPFFLWWLGVLLLVAGTAGRLLQQSVSGWREAARLIGVVVLMVLLAIVMAGKMHAATSLKAAPPYSEAEMLEVAVPFIAREEGKRNQAYRDVVGVWTICYGSTRAVRAGMVKSDAECEALLRDEVAEYRAGLHRYFTARTKTHRLTINRDTAYTSLAFNAGIRAIGRSTATRRLNAGDIRGGCEALSWWNKAGGRIVRGLVARRERERALCLEGL